MLKWHAVCFVCLVGVCGTRAEERPNILFCFADDWGRYASVFADHEKAPNANHVVKTPNIDRVAREGVLFRRAFVNAPSCTPCRSALLSGRYFFNTGRGAILQGAVWDSTIPSWPHMLRDSGYHIGETYKVWSPGTPNDAPFGAGKHAFEKAGALPNNYSENVSQMIAKGQSLFSAKEKIHAQVKSNFDAFLAASKPNQPWLYWFGPTTTHRTWIKGSGKALWGIEPNALRGKLPAFLPDVPEVRQDFADYLGEVQAFDSYIGVLLKRLEEAGQLDKTVIVISGDHGAPGFTHGKCNLYDFGVGVTLAVRKPGAKPGRIVDDFVNLMDLAPTFLELGGLKPAPGMDAKSIVPLLTSDKSGRIDVERSFVVTGRERHVGGAREGNLPYPHRALRTDAFLYIRNFEPDRWPMGAPGGTGEFKAPTPADWESKTMAAFADMDASPTKAWLIAHKDDPKWKSYYDSAFAKRPAEELYDLEKDRDQLHNVAGESEYGMRKAELAERLMSILKDRGDPRVTGDKMHFERTPFTDAFNRR